MSDNKIRHGADTVQTEAENRAARVAQGGELTSNGVLTKVLRDGKVEVIPTSEVYSKEAKDRVEGLEVADPTVFAAGVERATVVDRAETEFNGQERGDAVSAHHAQGAAGSIGREIPVEAKLEKGLYDNEQEKQAEKAAEVAAEDRRSATNGGSGEGDFDASDPGATKLSDLAEALEGLSDAEVKKAQKLDERIGAEAIYEKRLSK